MPRPVKGVAYNVSVSLYKTDGSLIANPGTVTAKISKDYGDYADVGTVSKEDSTYSQLKLALTATEMNADYIDLYVVDNTTGCIPVTLHIATEGDIKTAMEAAGGHLALILEDTGTTLPGLIGTDFGTDTCTLTIRTTAGAVIADAQTYVSTSAAGTVKSRVKTTDSLGQVKFDLTAGVTYYLWVTHDDYTGTNPTAFTAVAD